MKKIIASAGMIALSAGVTQAAVGGAATADKPWDVSLTVRGFYDDNYNTAQNGTLQKRDSFGLEVRPSAGLSLNAEQTSFGARYTYDMRYYADRDRQINGQSQSSADHSHEFNAWMVHAFSERYSLDVADTFVIAQEPQLLDPNNLSRVTRSNGNNIHNDGNIQFHAQVTRLLEVVLGYRNDLFDYDNKDYAGLLNRLEHYANIDLRWQLSPQTIGVLGYQLGLTEYTGKEAIGTSFITGLPLMSDVRNLRSHYVYVGADHTFRRDLIGSLRIGGQFTDYYNQHTTSISPYVDLSLRYNYTANSVLEVGFQHHRNTTDASSMDQETSAIFASLSYAITPKLIANLNGQYQNSAYNGGSVFAGGPSNSTSDNIYLAGVSLEYHFTRHLSADVGYNYDKVDSQLAGRSYDRNRVYLGMTARY